MITKQEKQGLKETKDKKPKPKIKDDRSLESWADLILNKMRRP